MTDRLVEMKGIIPKKCSFRVLSRNGIGTCLKPEDEPDADFLLLRCQDSETAPAKCPLRAAREDDVPLRISRPSQCPFRSLSACDHPERPVSEDYLIMRCSNEKKFPYLCPLKKAGE